MSSITIQIIKLIKCRGLNTILASSLQKSSIFHCFASSSEPQGGESILALFEMSSYYPHDEIDTFLCERDSEIQHISENLNASASDIVPVLPATPTEVSKTMSHSKWTKIELQK